MRYIKVAHAGVCPVSRRNDCVIDSVPSMNPRGAVFFLRCFAKVFVYVSYPHLIEAVGEMPLVHSSELRINFSLAMPLGTRIVVFPLNWGFQF